MMFKCSKKDEVHVPFDTENLKSAFTHIKSAFFQLSSTSLRDIHGIHDIRDILQLWGVRPD